MKFTRKNNPNRKNYVKKKSLDQQCIEAREILLMITANAPKDPFGKKHEDKKDES